MLDRIFQSPLGAVGLIVFVLILGGIYLVNRERAQVQRLKGPRRFQPDWSRSRGPRRRRRRRRGQAFQPAWTERESSPRTKGSKEDASEDSPTGMEKAGDSREHPPTG